MDLFLQRACPHLLHHPFSAKPQNLPSTHKPKLSPPLPPTTHPFKHFKHVTDAKKKTQCSNFYQRVNPVTPCQRTDLASILEKFPHIILCIRCMGRPYKDESGQFLEKAKLFQDVKLLY